MRTLSSVWSDYRTYTSHASETVRTSAIAGLAAVWLFSGAQNGDITKIGAAPDTLVLGGAFFALSLALDILHYTSGAVCLRHFAKDQEDNHNKSGDDAVDVPKWVPGVPTSFFGTKILALFLGYACVVWVLVGVVR